MKTSPVQKSERIVTLDIVRGVALLGILFANMSFFKSPVYQMQSLPGQISAFTDPFDEWTAFFIDVFVVGKFYPMFSLLFGLGFYLFYERLKHKELPAKKIYIRRLIFLIILGLAHLVFIWSGDILHTYAVTGFFLLFFVRRKAKTLLYWGISLITVSAVVFFLLTTAGGFVISLKSGTALELEATNLVQAAHAIYSSGTYGEILSFRLTEEVIYIIINIFFTVPNILGIFLLGMYIGRRNLIQQPINHLPFWKKLQLISFIIGGPLAILYACLQHGFFDLPYWLASGIAEGLNIFAGPLLMLFYVASAVLWLRRPHRTRLFQPIASVGKMALTNYLCQSLIGVFIFYGFGLGFYGTVGPTAGALLTILIYSLQTVGSVLWLKYFNQGPLEKAWRIWTYR
ncbi:DUF418 domain-containing protein [Bacillus piscicola]|uniref:DUF418 domain-containing protein n=1 Tax=Bacillus piscicola TaxID=1632684 RepID=UPI001F0975F5|nr:DUF418 domain-containing protein [Bacillus piscicola]